MQKGQIVSVYQDPLTEKQLEGQARLVELVQVESGIVEYYRLERWIVEFPDDLESGQVERIVRVIEKEMRDD